MQKQMKIIMRALPQKPEGYVSDSGEEDAEKQEEDDEEFNKLSMLFKKHTKQTKENLVKNQDKIMNDPTLNLQSNQDDYDIRHLNQINAFDSISFNSEEDPDRIIDLMKYKFFQQKWMLKNIITKKQEGKKKGSSDGSVSNSSSDDEDDQIFQLVKPKQDTAQKQKGAKKNNDSSVSDSGDSDSDDDDILKKSSNELSTLRNQKTLAIIADDDSDE